MDLGKSLLKLFRREDAGFRGRRAQGEPGRIALPGLKRPRGVIATARGRDEHRPPAVLCQNGPDQRPSLPWGSGWGGQGRIVVRHASIVGQSPTAARNRRVPPPFRDKIED